MKPARCTEVNVRDISQLTYRLSAARPQQCEPAVAMLVVGENRLSFATDKLPLTLKTPHGTITLPAGGSCCRACRR